MNGLLVVDDEEGVRRAVQKALGKENYEVFHSAQRQRSHHDRQGSSGRDRHLHQ